MYMVRVNKLKAGIAGTILALLVLITIVVVTDDNAAFDGKILWDGSDGYQYRIPGIIVTDEGTIIAYCERRKSLDDWSEISIVEKNSNDNGDSWSDTNIVVDGIASGKTVNNPVMISDGAIIHLLFEVEYG